MPLPMWAAGIALNAAQNPEVQNAAMGVGRGLGRGANYIAQGAGNLAQNVGTGLADRLGALGGQYLPQSVNTIGGYGRQGLGYLSGGLGGLYNAIAGNNQQQPGMMGGMMPAMAGQMGQMGMGGQMTPQEMMQQYYQQQIQQDQLGNQQQQLTDQYNQQLIPQLAARFGGTRNSAFQRMAVQGAGNLQRDLGALGEQSRMQRLGQIAPYLQGQQQLGLGQQQLGLQGTIAEREHAARMLGAMGGFGQQQQQNYMNQLLNRLNAQGNLGNLAQGQAFQNLNVGGQAPIWQQMAGGAANMFGQGAQAGLNRAFGL